MQTIKLMEYGPPEALRLAEAEKPVPKDDQLLVRVRAVSVNFGDLIVRDFKAISPRDFHMPALFWLLGKLYFGFRKPRVTILGSEFSGEVEAVGAAVTRFRPGDAVFGYRGPLMAAYAEYLCVPERGIVAPKPAAMTWEEAAAVPYGAIMALGVLRKIQVRPGQKVLVVGASGGIGPAIVQLAVSSFGARVTGVCSAARLDYVRELGAEAAIDYTAENFADRGETWDFIIDILGKTPFSVAKRALASDGRFVLVSFKMKQVLQMLASSAAGRKKLVCALVDEKPEDLFTIKEIIEAGRLKAIVDRSFPLEEAAAAHRYAESGKKKGCVVLTVVRETPIGEMR